MVKLTVLSLRNDACGPATAANCSQHGVLGQLGDKTLLQLDWH